jgi:hypothetical protein
MAPWVPTPNELVTAQEGRGLRLAIRFPTDREVELTRRFTVNLNYFVHMHLWLEAQYGTGDDLFRGLANELLSRPAFTRLNRRAADLDAIRELLTVSWMSEVQLRLPGMLGGPEMVRYSNAWAPVHAYYAVYMALQAWFEASGFSGVIDDHSASLRTIANQLRDRDLLPPPWGVLAVGCPMRGDTNYLNAPHGAGLSDSIEVLANPVLAEFWQRYGTWLRATREARLKLREAESKRRRGWNRISPAERTRIAAAVWPTSFFDCLFRLRVRSNYRTVEPYLVRFISDDGARAFHESLSTCTAATLALLELYIARSIGASELGQLVGSVTGGDPHGITSETVGRRVRVFRTVAPHLVRN